MNRLLPMLISLFFISQAFGQDFTLDYILSLKSPGNVAKNYPLRGTEGRLKSTQNLPVIITQNTNQTGKDVILSIVIEAKEDCYVNLNAAMELPEYEYETTQFYLPGFWYRKNLRSPENAPSVKVSKSWMVREDRLSTPLTGAYNENQNKGINLIRLKPASQISLTPLNQGEVILSGPADLGALGFAEDNGNVNLTFAIPYQESPHSYYRKLTLGSPVSSYLRLRQGEKINCKYLIRTYGAQDYAEFVAKSWSSSYDLIKPAPVKRDPFTDEEIKQILSKFYKQSFIATTDLKGYSGVHLQTYTCDLVPLLEVGFVGRVLLNAFNSLEFGYQQDDQSLINISNQIWDSYLFNGFTKGGFFREVVDELHNWEADVFSIRRQSEGLYAALFYLNFEKKAGRKHPDWEKKVRRLFELFTQLQKDDGSFPRKFNDNLKVKDNSGGSSSCVVPPLVMAYQYFGDKQYLDIARKVAKYQEVEIISKSDYFSSTLDANCEDKEASLYVATSLYYLAQVTKDEERKLYVDLAKKASYFALSWYYTWDVPFAQGQMLGDIGFKTRGWGNVSVENNHVDVYIFEFDEILDWLTAETGEVRFGKFSEVIRSSMRSQLLPYEGHMVGVAKEGFYPEVVQHTQWDYGKFGKGFYNDLFAPGWTVASLWEMLTHGRTKKFFE